MWEKYKQPLEMLEKVHYEIRGPLLVAANKLEAAGHKILKLNIGNPAAFGFDVPEAIVNKLYQAVTTYHGYCDSKGLLVARQAIMRYNQALGINTRGNPDWVYIGNGVSELIMITTRALCEQGFEILVPSPDYPLWTAAINLTGGTAVHYHCNEQTWEPDIADLEAKINDKTRAIVIINPNNPTGMVYSRQVLEEIVTLARKHELIILSDEIYDRITYDGAKHIPIASLTDDVMCITFNGASKSNRLCGYRLGWMQLSGPFEQAPVFVRNVNKLTSMRLCSVVPFQDIIPECLETDKSIYQLTAPGGRLYEQKQLCQTHINQIPGLSCTAVTGALYAFVKIDLDKLDFADDLDFATKLLHEEHVLVVHGQGFNWPGKDHFRIVFLPSVTELETALDKIEKLCRRHLKN